MKPIEQMTESELIQVGKDARRIVNLLNHWQATKYYPPTLERAYWLTKDLEAKPFIEAALKKIEDLYRTKFKK